MSEDGESIISQIPGRLLLFLIVMIVSAPFMLVGYYKNSQIESCLESAGKCMASDDYLAAEKKLDEGASHFGILYDLYVILPSFGGKYYKQDDYFGIRGVARTAAIAQRMAEGEVNVEELIKEANADLETRGSFSEKSAPLREVARKQMVSIKKMLPIMRLVKSGEHQKAFTQFQAFLREPGNLEYEVILMPVCRLSVDLAENAQNPGIGESLIGIVRAAAQESKNPFFQELLRRASMIDFDAKKDFKKPARVASSRPEPAVTPSVSPTKPEEKTFEQKFADGLAMARKKDFNKALPILEECYKVRPDNDNICYALALTLKNLGKSSEVKRLCEEMLQRNAENTKAQKLLASLK
jgi:tetratricopeptide (TPR) repeat protein